MRKVIMLLVVAVVVIVGVTIGLNVASASKEQSAVRAVADTFVANVLKGDTKTTYSALTSNAQSNISQSAWQDRVNTLALFFTARKSTFDSITTGKNDSSVTYSIPGNDGTYQFVVNEVKTTGQWQVDSFTSKLTKPIQ